MATIIVENGTQVASANSYVTTTELQTYADDRGITIVSTSLATLLIEAMDYIESLVYQGYKYSSTQALQWPRANVYIDSWYVPVTTIPQQLKNGQMAAALAIDAGIGPLADVIPAVKRKKVGELEIEYQDGAPAATYTKTINSALWKLLAGGGLGANVIKVSKA